MTKMIIIHLYKEKKIYKTKFHNIENNNIKILLYNITYYNFKFFITVYILSKLYFNDIKILNK